MMAINDYYDSATPKNNRPRLVRGRPDDVAPMKPSFTDAFLTASVMHHLPTPQLSVASSSVIQTSQKIPERETSDVKLSSFVDIPLLVSDHEEEESDAETYNDSKNNNSKFQAVVASEYSAAEEVKRSIKEERGDRTQSLDNANEQVSISTDASLSQTTAPQNLAGTNTGSNRLPESPQPIREDFHSERAKVMKIIVKYVAMKIKNSFPPESARTHDPNEMPLDVFLMILVSRLQLSLTSFMKGIIYLFRYMDIIYLLRYLNQSNNFANYNEMGYGPKQLIIGCYRLVLAREKVQKDWSAITGLSNARINAVVKTLVGRLNGKLIIKNIELIRLRSEIYRFVNMVTTSEE